VTTFDISPRDWVEIKMNFLLPADTANLGCMECFVLGMSPKQSVWINQTRFVWTNHCSFNKSSHPATKSSCRSDSWDCTALGSTYRLLLVSQRKVLCGANDGPWQNRHQPLHDTSVLAHAWRGVSIQEATSQTPRHAANVT